MLCYGTIKEFRLIKKLVLLLVCIPVYLYGIDSNIPSDKEVEVALQSMLVAGAATFAGQVLTPPLIFAEAVIVADPAYTMFSLEMEQADIGHLRTRVLQSPVPEFRQMGFLEALLTSVVRIIPDYPKLIAYLKPQGLYENEVILSGSIKAQRFATPYPFRYEGSASLKVEGSRFRFPFALLIQYVIPLEGPLNSTIIPLVIQANGEDFLDVGRALFSPDAT